MVWGYMAKLNELFRGESTLDEVQVSRAYEAFGRAMTVKQVRKIMTDCDVDKDKRLSFYEMLCQMYVVSWTAGIKAPQGDPSDLLLIEQSQKEINDAQAALQLAQQMKEAATQSQTVATKAANDAAASKALVEKAERAAMDAEVAAKTGLAKIEAALSEAERFEDVARDRMMQVIEQEAEALMQEVGAKKKEVLAMQAEGVSDKVRARASMPKKRLTRDRPNDKPIARNARRLMPRTTPPSRRRRPSGSWNWR
jgi:hypothetical protein